MDIPIDRNLDVLMATEVMGWKLKEDPSYSKLCGAMMAIKPSGEKIFLWPTMPNVYSAEKTWSPSQNIVDAWEVKDRMIELGYVFLFHHNRPDAKPESVAGIAAKFYSPSTMIVIHDFFHAETDQTAICMAALEAIKQDK